MPTYQYACTACGHQLEAVQSFADEPLTECPACEGRLRKLFSSVGVVFKGSGFYRTDSRAKATSSESASASSESSSSSKETTKTADAKPSTTSSSTSSTSSSSSTSSPAAA